MNPTKRAFADVKRAPIIYSLPECPNGCGEMLALDDGWQCPICYRYLGYRRGEQHP